LTNEARSKSATDKFRNADALSAGCGSQVPMKLLRSASARQMIAVGVLLAHVRTVI
jgi:hypothetical protein